MIKLTSDEDDACLYVVHMDEQRFMQLKAQQQLLVGFDAFTNMLMGLINAVCDDESKQTQRLIQMLLLLLLLYSFIHSFHVQLSC